MLNLESVINIHISFKERFNDSNFLSLSQIGNIGFCYLWNLLHASLLSTHYIWSNGKAKENTSTFSRGQMLKKKKYTKRSFSSQDFSILYSR